MLTAGNKDRVVSDLVRGAKDIRQSLNVLYKELLVLGRKAKYLEPVGAAVASAMNELIEAEMAVKAVVDSGNQWVMGREGSDVPRELLSMAKEIAESDVKGEEK